ncbi:FxSxx-COOH cyclophane-containing RiPP peptide [Streptomyces sp. NBC_01237]|uniref:FxSxx-COOH cyclophane-containing RiPP peptide n=1 Tax=Streptomyces sp. NBC_01237 TaxID=2903790 RepID=UPI002DDC8656|nr:FxSxx-COOH cyclophane-containing RiPP peptide [Streptomyces sp. NBC_01237]WRZ71575.1 FxSxx-COOH protein [Streptomyces sp. NBC_01237]
MKIYESSPAFANAKSRAPLTEIDVRDVDTTRKVSRVFGASTGRNTRTSNFSSAL